MRIALAKCIAYYVDIKILVITEARATYYFEIAYSRSAIPFFAISNVSWTVRIQTWQLLQIVKKLAIFFFGDFEQNSGYLREI